MIVCHASRCTARLRIVASSSTSQHHPSLLHTHAAPPPASQLDTAAYFSCLSGLAYRNDTELQHHLARKQLSLVAAGETSFTRWFVAQGTLPHAGTTPTRALLLRGVDWRGTSASGQSTQLWRQLSRCWPVPLLPDLTRPSEALVCHAGVADMAALLYDQVAPHVEAHNTVFAGHSLGGALAVVLCVMARLMHGAAAPQCFTFGSPPVVTHSSALPDGAAALRVLGLPGSAMQHYVLDQDPVPRAMLAVDPTLSLLKRVAGLQPLLDVPRSMLGGTPVRFLMDLPMGEVFLLKLDRQRVHRLTGDEALALEMPVGEMLGAPSKVLKALLDHSHSAYTQELRAAARYLQHKEEHSR